MRKAIVSFFVLSLISIVACGGDVGDSCDEEGKVGGECDDGNVCGKAKASGGDLVCLKQCTNAADCGAGEECNGVSKTSLKGCQPR